MKRIIIVISFILLGVSLTSSSFEDEPILIWSEQGKDSVVNWTGLDSLEYTFFDQDTTILLDSNGIESSIAITITHQKIQEGIKRLREFRCK